MKKIFKRFVRITFLTILAGVLTTATIVLFPQQLFAKKICYKKFAIYSNENVDDNIKTVLDNASVLLKKSELYDSDYEYNIILCNNSFYNKIDDILLGVGRTATATLKNVIIKVQIDPKQDLA